MKQVYMADENKARIGAGGAIYLYDTPLAKYRLAMILAKVGVPKSSVGDVEVKVSSSATIGKINGVETLDAVELDFYMHRDSIMLLESINGKTMQLATIYPDYTGYKYIATLTYTPGETEMDGAMTGTVKITPKTKPEFVADFLPLIVPTVHFNEVEDDIELDTMTSAYLTSISLKEEGGTVTPICSDPSIATVAWADGVATITGKKAGSCIVTYTGTKEGYAPWKTTSHVIVPSTSASPASAPTNNK